MAVLYGCTHVDEKYSALLEPNLYYNGVFADGKTFTSKYEVGPAGGIYVHKLNTNAVAVGTPGRDFTDELTTDELIPIIMNNNYQKSKKLYGVQAEAIEADVADGLIEDATAEIAESVQASGLACLVSEAGTTASTTGAVTTANIKKLVLADRKAIVKAKGKADVILMSPDTFATLLEASGSEYTPVANDAVNATGQVGKWLGFDVYECAGLSATSGSYYNSNGSLTTATFTAVDYIMYNHEALSIIPNFERSRVIDSENFNGVKAQVEMNMGFKVTSPAQVVAKKH